MLDISFAELCLVLLVAIIFISPKNFPTLFKAMSKLYKKAKNSLLDIKDEIEREDGRSGHPNGRSGHPDGR